MSFPKKEQRNQCYNSRDRYWQCMDENEGKDAETMVGACKQWRDLFAEHCPPQWVTHFERKYKYLKFKEKIDSGFDPLEESQQK